MSRDTWVDLGFVVVLAGVALSGLATSFTGWSFLVVGLAGVVIATAVTHVGTALRWPLVAPVVIVLVAFLLLGGPLCLRALGTTAFVPGPATLDRLVEQALFGWKDLLTTLPPVDGDGPLLVLPWVLGLLAGLVVTAVAERRTARPWLTAVLPVAAMTLVLAAVLLLGVRHPHSLLVQGMAFSGLSLGWMVLRARRESASVRGGSSGWGRLAAGTALVALAAGLALPASVAVTGADDEDRAVLRTWVEPPFDIGRYPSPLAGFRKYVDLRGESNPANVFDETLFTIDGVPAGTRVRIAALDAYDGLVWGATNDALPGAGGDAFQRVSSTIDNPVAGQRVEATVTLGEGYGGVWLPTVGALTSIELDTVGGEDAAESFRYNLATSTAVVPAGLAVGDSYRFTAALPADALDERDVPSGDLVAPPEGTAFLQEPALSWGGRETAPMARVFAIAAHLRSEGKYSDGVGRSQARYTAGHSLKRLGDGFVNAQQMVGNDEQYAATMALLAERVGVPARVVLGAAVPRDGVVRGEHVQAWVELRVADGSWQTLATETFMSQEPPATELPETTQPMTGTVVPPPAPIPPPTDAGEQSDADLKERKGDKRDKDEKDEEDAILPDLPSWAVRALTYVGLPLSALAVGLGAIVLAKVVRRRRRRRAPTASGRFVGAWHELVDHARDLGHSVPLGHTVTRREQSGALGTPAAPGLARRADAHVFGPGEPREGEAAEYWQHVDAERRAMSRQVDRRRRWLAAVRLTSFRGVRSGARPGRLRFAFHRDA